MTEVRQMDKQPKPAEWNFNKLLLNIAKHITDNELSTLKRMVIGEYKNLLYVILAPSFRRTTITIVIARSSSSLSTSSRKTILAYYSKSINKYQHQTYNTCYIFGVIPFLTEHFK